MAVTVPWYSEHATIFIGTLLASVATNTTLDKQVTTTEYTSEIVDVAITGGERDLDAIKLLGYNEARDLKRATPIQCAFTIKSKDAEDFAQLIGGASVQVTGFTTFKRVTFGEKSSGDRVAKAVLVKCNDGTNTMNILLNNAYCTTYEWSLSADATNELKVTFKALASDCYAEDDVT